MNFKGSVKSRSSKTRARKNFNNLVGVIKLLLCVLLCAGLTKGRSELRPTRRPSHPLGAHTP